MIRLIFSLVLLLAVCAVLAAPAPDPFKSGWGTPVDPDRDCKISRDGGTLTIEMPGGDHDYDIPRERLIGAPGIVEFPGRERAEGSRERLNAPRIDREFEGDFEIQLRVRIDSRQSAKSSVKGLPSFVAAGFLVTFPDTFSTLFHRFQYGVAGAGTTAEGFATQLSRSEGGGSVRGVCDKKWGKWPFKAKPEHVYMRLERKEILLHCEISPDRKEWVSIGGLNYIGLPSKLKVGLGAFSTSTEPSRVRFDQFKLIRGRKKSQ